MTSPNYVQDGTSREADKFVVRLPGGMRARISTLARDRRQSMNSYIICALESVLKTDEEADGTYVAPVVEMVVPAQMVAIKPSWAAGMACRYNGVPKIIEGLEIHESGSWIEATIEIGEHLAGVPLEDLEPY